MPRQNPTYDTAHPFNPWRLLGPAWDPEWKEKEPPAPAKTWMRSEAGRAATDQFFATYAEAEALYLESKKPGADYELYNKSRRLRRRARNYLSKLMREAGNNWRADQIERINHLGKYKKAPAAD